ncbi:MAG: exopolysaccharide biosynthesis protein [Terrimicrobiaceae bacterium]
MKTYEELIVSLEQCVEDAKGRKLTVRDTIDRLEEGSYAFLCLLFTIPFLQPISLGPISAIGGLTFAVLGWQWARAKPTPWIPKRLAAMHLSGSVWAGLLAGCKKLLLKGKRFARRRLPYFVEGKLGDLFAGVLMIVGGVLISVPFPGIPFNNTFPAMIIVFACIGWLEKDGLFTILAAAWILVSLLYFALIFSIFFFLGSKALNWLPEILR